ncbi:MAG: hypothetical protein UZ21_OP11001000926 [Microgenomates bacterium OLB22]|nr:MAG: hypothetical protein UZ21_OP11001000926 [Microgenomates bacterium OLB22]
MKYVFIFIVLFILLFSAIAVLMVTDTYVFKPSARASLQETSSESSFVVTSPSVASLQAKTKVRASIICLSTTGVGIPNIEVSIQGHELLTIEPVQPITDSRGKAIFDIMALSTVDSELPVFCGNTKIVPTVHILVR